MPEELSIAELDMIEQRARSAREAAPTPWRAWLETKHATGGASFIQFGDSEDRDDEMYLDIQYGPDRAISPDPRLDAVLDFIANASDDVDRLIAEVRRLRDAER